MRCSRRNAQTNEPGVHVARQRPFRRSSRQARRGRDIAANVCAAAIAAAYIDFRNHTESSRSVRAHAPLHVTLVTPATLPAARAGIGKRILLPLGAILDWTMSTPAGFAAFRDRRINAMIKKLLGAWCEFLSSSDSRYVLNDSPSG